MNSMERLGWAHVEQLIDAAQAHGEESEPDHEVGDLQDLVRSCWEIMTPAQRRRVYASQIDVASDWLRSMEAE